MALGRKTGGRTVGTPNRATDEIRKAAQPYGRPAIERLAALAGLLVDDAGNPVPGAENEAIQVTAIKELLDRGYGRPAPEIVSQDNAQSITFLHLTAMRSLSSELNAQRVIEAATENQEKTSLSAPFDLGAPALE